MQCSSVCPTGAIVEHSEWRRVLDALENKTKVSRKFRCGQTEFRNQTSKVKGTPPPERGDTFQVVGRLAGVPSGGWHAGGCVARVPGGPGHFL